MPKCPLWLFQYDYGYITRMQTYALSYSNESISLYVTFNLLSSSMLSVGYRHHLFMYLQLLSLRPRSGKIGDERAHFFHFHRWWWRWRRHTRCLISHLLSFLPKMWSTSLFRWKHGQINKLQNEMLVRARVHGDKIAHMNVYHRYIVHLVRWRVSDRRQTYLAK